MSQDRKNIYTTLLKPTWGIISENPAKLAKFAQEICKQAANFQKEGGKLLILPYQRGQEVITQIVLSLVFSQFFKQGIIVKYVTPTLTFDYNSDLLKAEILLIDNLPVSQGLASLLFSNKWQQLIIATGTLEQWEQIQIDVPYRIYDFLSAPTINWQQPFAEDLEIEKKEVGVLSQQEKDIYKEVITLDFLGVSIPIDLLAHSLNLQIKETLDLITLLEEKSLLNWIELESSASLLVSANAPEIAQAMLSFLNIQSSDLFDYFKEIIQSTETNKKDERYTIMNLFQTALLGNYADQPEIFISRVDLRNLAEVNLKKLREIWAEGDVIEHLLWGKVLENLSFDLSAEVFAEGLRKNPRNSYLLQAQARMFGNWALVEPSKMDKAEDLFDELTNSTSDNPYFLQAQGVFEANRQDERRNISRARECFDDALSIAQGIENKTCILTAWANLEIDEGNYATAENKLNEISSESESKSPYIPHLWAKLYFYRGDYENGAEKLKELFAIRPYSIEGWNLIGEIALKRGHWQKAKTAFNKVLQIQPENIHTLRALGDLETDLGKAATDFEKAEKHFNNANEKFTKALEIEPYNYFVEVSQNVLFRNKLLLSKKLNKKEEATEIFAKSETALKKLLEKFKKNEFITHNLGELYQANGLYEKAKRYFAALCEKNKTLPYLVGLAKAEQSLGNDEDAKSNLLEAEQFSNSSKQKLQDKIRSLNSLAEIWLSLDNLEKAENLAQTALDLDRENCFTLRFFAKIQRELGNEEEADSFEENAQTLARKELGDFLAEKK